MQANPLLSIVIPTYNRSDFLDYCLKFHISILKKYNLEVFISDNASTDTTEDIARKWSIEYPLIQYRRNETNLGPDENFEKALKYPKSEYVWLLGDSYQIPFEAIEYFFDLVSEKNQKYDVIVYNSMNRVVDILQQNYSDHNKLLSDLGWHMTCMSCLVYNSQLISNANFKRYRNTCFIQTGIIFEAISNNDFIVHWAQEHSVQNIKIDNKLKDSWQPQTLEIWVRKWANFILSFPPSYHIEVKLKCIKDHGLNTHVFTIKSMLSLRGLNFINYKICRHYSPLFPLTASRSRINIMWLIAILPRSIAQNIKNIYRAIKIY